MTAYHKLCELAREISILSSTGSVLGWDQETYMPDKALHFRAKQLAYLSGRAHALATSGRFLAALEKAEGEKHPRHSKEAANIEVMREEFERAFRIPTKLVEEESAATTHAKAAWVEARKKSEFALFAPHLEKLLGFARLKAELWGYDGEPYDALLSGYERGARTREVAALFDKLKPDLVSIAREAVERSKSVPEKLLRGKFPAAKQQQLNREVAESIGFDFTGGRIDTTAHPFCSTVGAGDVRLTTRYDESDFTSSLFGVMHEAGHGMYEQGLPAEDFGLPSGTAVSLGIHESQSRLWENHVGRSHAFWEKWLPRAAEIFPNLRGVKLKAFLAWVNRAEFSFIRVEADEATYDLHVLLRFGIERRMVRGDLKVADVPAAWNDEFKSLFGMTPPDDRRGCLQDIHWSMGGLGYFATYSLGNLNGAQLFSTAMRQKRISDAAAMCDYAPLLAWLRTKVHARGSTLMPADLMREATGRETTPKAYLAHLRSRFLGR
ncbi:MAG: carboxypeptidase M32 [Verrucomicrobiaceae bacterium]|nr:carboxypeptidase M32 [Verrucomicrobiaceae bacterium]